MNFIRSHWKDFKLVFRITWEFWWGFNTFRNVKNAVTVFGSARFQRNHRYCDLAFQLGKRLADAGFTVVTGAGPGIMEASSEGAKAGGGKTYGANIVVPHEQRSNPYVDRTRTFKYFFARKMILTRYSLGYIFMPGGYGTFDELFEVLTLMRTGKREHAPVILMGVDYWKPFFQWLEHTVLSERAIDLKDFQSLVLTDDVNQVAEIIQTYQKTLSLTPVSHLTTEHP